eukprot:2684822-Pleurochrysis_carterae.AAC.1
MSRGLKRLLPVDILCRYSFESRPPLPSNLHGQVALVELWLGLGSTSDGKHLLWATRVQNASGSAVSVPDTSGHAGARGSLSWPFTGFSYILLRKNTTQRDAGEDCATRREVVKFWRWFYTSTVVASIASDQLMASLPLVAAEPVLRQLEREVMCEDKPAFEPVQKPKLSIVGPGDFVRCSPSAN